jgi:peptidyl-prolyl cis-trans isomerase D
MQIIQGIRDKGAAIVIVVIALSLIGFILMDAKQGANKMFGSNTTDIGKVNGQTIELAEFNQRVKTAETQEEQRSGQKTRPERSAQIREETWNQIVAEKVFYKEADKLGIDFTANELSAILSSDDRNNPLMQDPQMVDQATGKLDPAKLREALNNIRKAKGEQRDMIDAQITEPQKLTSISTKYFSLLNASAYYPSWMEESDKKDKQNFANISYVAIAYNELSDSSYKVSDAEINDYVSKHKPLFKQEPGRKISYVTFSQLPSVEDSSKIKDLVSGLKNDFTAENNVKMFLAKNASMVEFDSNYLPKIKIQSAVIDTLTKLAPGSVFGPYVDKGSYVLAKLISTKSFPDSIRARHILVPTNDPKTGQPTMEDSVGKKRADSILAAIKAGAKFEDMALKLGTDGTKDKGGDLGFFGYSGPMVEEFNQALFGKPVGTLEVIRTRFGYHVIELTAEKGSQPAYKFAFMAKEITASDVTITKASNDATKLAAEKDPKKFDAYLQKNGIKKTTANDLIKENDANVGQMQDARQLVRWAFEASIGDVSEPFLIGDNFVVAVLDKIEKEGLQDAQTARPMAEAAIKVEKKTADILKKLGNNPTLESAAAAYSKQILSAGADSSIVFPGVMINNIGQEPKIIGAAFNRENQSKVSAPIVGKTGIYIIKVNSIGTKGVDTPEAEATWKTQQLASLRNGAATNWFDGLKKKASITDNRSKFF